MPLDTTRLHDEIRKVYSEVVGDPKKGNISARKP